MFKSIWGNFLNISQRIFKLSTFSIIFRWINLELLITNAFTRVPSHQANQTCAGRSTSTTWCRQAVSCWPTAESKRWMWLSWRWQTNHSSFPFCQWRGESSRTWTLRVRITDSWERLASPSAPSKDSSVRPCFF